MVEKILVILLLLVTNFSLLFGIEAEKVRPISDKTIFAGNEVQFMLKAKDSKGLAYTQWSINGKNLKKNIVSGYIGVDSFTHLFEKAGKYFITANVHNILGKSTLLIWRINVEAQQLIVQEDPDKVEPFIEEDPAEDPVKVEPYIEEDPDIQGKEFEINEAPNPNLPSFIVGISSTYFMNELTNFDKVYDNSNVIQYGADLSFKIFSLNQNQGVYLSIGYNYLTQDGYVLDYNLIPTDIKSTWTNHKLNLSAEYRYGISELFSLYAGIGSSFYLISEEKQYTNPQTIDENHFGFNTNLGLSYNIFSIISLYTIIQYDYIPVKLKNYGNDNLGGIGTSIGLEINF